MSGRNNGAIHRNRLLPSDEDLVQLAEAVEQRFTSVLDLHERVLGFPLCPPTELQNDMVLWRTMIMRHRKGDKRNTDDEKRAVRRIAQWTLDQNCILRNQPLQKLAWKD